MNFCLYPPYVRLSASNPCYVLVGGERQQELSEVYSSIVKFCDPTDTKVRKSRKNYLADRIQDLHIV